MGIDMFRCEPPKTSQNGRDEPGGPTPGPRIPIPDQRALRTTVQGILGEESYRPGASAHTGQPE